MTIAVAHPNIALIKYWGKQDKPGNIPATPSLSITLSELTTTTKVSDADRDEFCLDGAEVDDPKLHRFLTALRQSHSVQPVRIESENNFPTSAGLASSASGFAALITALDAHCGLGLDPGALAAWARRGSASAARSIFGGFVSLEPPAWTAAPLFAEDHWDLRIIVAVTGTAAKAVGSTEGMERSRLTSPFYPAWTETAAADFRRTVSAVESRDFAELADVAEHNCLKMHSVMLTSKPTLSYWNAATIDCMDALRGLRESGAAVFFTIDAGPQIKAVCLPSSAGAVRAMLGDVTGVHQVIECRLGPGAAVEEPAR